LAAETIFALASGRPPAAIAIIRVSGARAHEAAQLISGELPAPRQAALRTFRDPRDQQLLDEGLLLRFDAPASATGEDVVEFHVHGGRAVAQAMLDALASLSGLREAQSGEFTRRAFENGRIDLTEAEGLADLIEAETETQRKAALAVAEGGLRRQVEAWRVELLALSARAEAAIDYADEDEVEDDTGLSAGCGALAAELQSWLERPRVEPLREGIRVVLAGPPNSGKSSLTNAIAGQERAIVTDAPGTTRDHIEVPLSLGGVPILLTDTAGLRATNEVVERIGVERAERLVELADILLWLGEPTDAPAHGNLILVHSRCDLETRGAAPPGSVAVSAVTGEGLKLLLEEVERRVRALLPAEDAVALNRRQAEHLTHACEAVKAAAATRDLVLIAENLRQARGAFDRITGRAGVEDVLDALFGRFCLGK
jgi:tRNA modification GTPase